MSPIDYMELDLDDQVKYVYQNGEFVMDIRYYAYKINLYRLHDYLVEVFYNHLSDEIEKVMPLNKDSSRMKFYLDQIQIS